MARGRHVRRSGWRSRLAAWLFPVEAPPPSWRAVHATSLVRLSDDVGALQAEVASLRAHERRTTTAEVLAGLRAQRLERELSSARAAVAGLRADLDALREELVWVSAERRRPADGPTVSRLSVARRAR